MTTVSSVVARFEKYDVAVVGVVVDGEEECVDAGAAGGGGVAAVAILHIGPVKGGCRQSRIGKAITCII